MAGRCPHSRDQPWSDEQIREDIGDTLLNSAHIDCSEVSVEVSNGKVTLDGGVPEQRMKRDIEDIAGACHGVSEVENRVRVQQPGERAIEEMRGSAER